MGLQQPMEPVVTGDTSKGRLLFEDEYKYRTTKGEFTFLGFLLAAVALILMVFLIIRPQDFHGGPGPTILFILFFLIVAAFLFYGIKKLRRFRLYEEGIEFSNSKISDPDFMLFSDIDYIERKEEEWIFVYTKSDGRFPRVISAPGRGGKGSEQIEDWPTFYQRFVNQLRVTHKDENEFRLVRDFLKVEWSEDAKKELVAKKSRWLRLESTNAINESVFKEGRNRVELSDVQKFLK